VSTHEWAYFGLGTAVHPSNQWTVALDAIEAMMSGAVKVGLLLMADTAAAEVVVLCCVRASLAAERRLGVGRPRERVLEEVTWCR
jgi:hypothetical protein